MHGFPGGGGGGRGPALSAWSLALAVALSAGPAANPARAEPTAAEEVLLSLLAVGDTGVQRALPWLRGGQRAVARGMAAEDLRHPVDALVLLGDLFYPRGLERRELVARVRDNLVGPYCRFADLDAPRSGEVADACSEPEERRHPVPIHAVPGNHDTKSPESLRLERRAIPDFLANWRMPDRAAETIELGSGVSLVLVDTPAVVRDGDFEAIRAALLRARGPWRIVAAHLPVAPGDPLADGEWRSGSPPLEHFSVPGAPVHLYLAGHRHNLQVIEGAPPGPRLHVIAGSGANVRPIRFRYASRRLALERTGFARVDLVGRGAEQRLRVSVFSVPRFPIFYRGEPERVAQWSVDRAGAVRRELPAGP